MNIPPSGFCRQLVASLAGTILAVGVLQGADTVNQPPQLLILNDPKTLLAPEDIAVDLHLVVADLETMAAELRVTAIPLQTNILSPTGITSTGTGAERTLRLTPVPNASGSVGLLLVVTDGAGKSTTNRTTVTWTSVDDPPVLTPIPNQVTVEGAPPLLVPVSFWDPDPQPVATLSASSSRSNFVQSATFTGTGTNRWLNLRPQTAARGSSVITVAAASSLPANSTNSTRTAFNLTVLPREMAPSNNVAPVTSGLQASAADVNRDGWLDLATGSNGRFERIVRNGSAGFQRVEYGLSQPTVPQIAWGDHDGDGDLDAYLASATGVGVLLRNETLANATAPLSFRTIQLLAPTNRVANAAWADFDGDGDLDLLADGGANARGTVERVFFARNDGGERFVRLNSPLPSARGPLLSADFDNDGRPDVLVPDADATRHQAVVWRNEGGFRFTATSLRVPAPGLLAAGTADFDGDGRLDLWVQHRRETNSPPTQRILSLWRQTFVGFAEELRVPTEAIGQAGPPTWGDFDGDGSPDFIAPAVNQSISGNSLQQRVTNHFALYRNDGRGSFTPGRFLFNNVIGGGPAAGDFNRDGLLDAWTPESQGRVFYNQRRDANLPPDAPTGLFALAGGTNVLFTWLTARDPNQTAPLTYNLRVGTRPGANDVIPSMSLADGTRLLPTPGNAGFATTRRLLLRAVDSDTLYWSVQAVDNSFAGSLWAVEQTVSVTSTPGEPPNIMGLTNVVMDEDTQRTLRYVVTDDYTPPSGIRLQVFNSNPALFPGYRNQMARATHDTPSTNRTIFLSPAANAFGEAEFTVVATDGRGLSTTKRFMVTVTPAVAAPQMQVSRAASATPYFTAQGQPAGMVILERSFDLLNWELVSTYTLDSTGRLEMPLAPPEGESAVFYRTRNVE